MFNTLFICIIFIIVFFLGRWSIFLGNQKALKELAYKMAIETMKDLSPTELTINLVTLEAKFDKPPINNVSIKFEGAKNLINDMLEDPKVDEDIKNILKSL